MPGPKEFDELLNSILTDYRNQFPGVDASQGSLVFIKSACLASALWGLYRYQDWIARQIFPDTAEKEALEHHAWVRGLVRTQGETDAAYLVRLLDYIRRPPAGGNKYDYVKWALEVDNVAAAYCFPIAQGAGTVDVVITANAAETGSEVPSSHSMSGTSTSLSTAKLKDSAAEFNDAENPARKGDRVRNTTAGTEATVISVDSATQLSLDGDIFTGIGQAYAVDALTVLVKEHLDDLRPVTASVVRVLPPTVTAQNITMTVSGAAVERAQIATDIAAYLASLIPGQKLYRSQLSTIAVENGAENAVITVPNADVTPTGYEMIRPGDINVS